MSETTQTETAETTETYEGGLATVTMELALADIRTDVLKNLRTVRNDAAIEQLAESLYQLGMLQAPGAIVVYETDDNGDIVTEDGEAVILETHCNYGYCRVAAATYLDGVLLAGHNALVASGEIADQEKEGYLFVDAAGEVIQTEIAPMFEYISVKCQEVAGELTPEIIAEANQRNLAENLSRDDLHVSDQIAGVNALLAQGLRQGPIASMTGLSQSSISQYKAVGKAIPAVRDALRTDKIILRTAITISKLVTPKTKVADKKAQAAALKEALASHTPGTRGTREKTKRSDSEVAAMYRNLTDENCFPDMDPTVRQTLRSMIVWYHMGASDEALTNGLLDEIQFDTPNIKVTEPKVKKAAPKKAAPKKAAPKKAAAVKAPAVAAAAEAAPAAATPAKKRRRRRAAPAASPAA